MTNDRLVRLATLYERTSRKGTGHACRGADSALSQIREGRRMTTGCDAIDEGGVVRHRTV
jgi:hypothetical protein